VDFAHTPLTAVFVILHVAFITNACQASANLSCLLVINVLVHQHALVMAPLALMESAPASVWVNLVQYPCLAIRAMAVMYHREPLLEAAKNKNLGLVFLVNTSGSAHLAQSVFRALVLYGVLLDCNQLV